FSDERGDYPAGSYVRNPPGSRHAPFSDGGCVIFVKLRQMQPDDRDRVVLRRADLDWQPAGAAGHERALLHQADGVRVTLERLQAGTTIEAGDSAGGAEMLVVAGTLQSQGRQD